MKREEKQVIIDNLTEQIKAHKHIYISDISELDAAATQELRRACFKAGIKLIQVKNTLLRVALDGLEADYNEIYSALTGSSAVMLSETGNAPAKLIKEFRKNHDKPVLKAAFVEECAYVGENQLDALVSINPRGPRIRPKAPILPMMAGIVIMMSISVQPDFNFSIYSSNPT